MAVDTTISTPAISIDCHRKIVWLNGMTPVMASRLGGRLAALAWSCAGAELSPSAQMALIPR
jgi:hypothetical protein